MVEGSPKIQTHQAIRELVITVKAKSVFVIKASGKHANKTNKHNLSTNNLDG